MNTNVNAKRLPQVEMMREKGYVSVSDASNRAGVTVFTIYRWVSAGKVEGLLVGRHWYVQLDSLIKYVGPKAAALLDMTDKKGRAVP